MSRRIDQLLDTIKLRQLDDPSWTAWAAIAAREFETDVRRQAARDHAHILRILATSAAAKARSYDRAENDVERDRHLEQAHALRHAADTVSLYQPTPLRRAADRSTTTPPKEEKPKDE